MTSNILLLLLLDGRGNVSDNSNTFHHLLVVIYILFEWPRDGGREKAGARWYVKCTMYFMWLDSQICVFLLDEFKLTISFVPVFIHLFHSTSILTQLFEYFNSESSTRMVFPRWRKLHLKLTVMHLSHFNVIRVSNVVNSNSAIKKLHAFVRISNLWMRESLAGRLYKKNY